MAVAHHRDRHLWAPIAATCYDTIYAPHLITEDAGHEPPSTASDPNPQLPELCMLPNGRLGVTESDIDPAPLSDASKEGPPRPWSMLMMTGQLRTDDTRFELCISPRKARDMIKLANGECITATSPRRECLTSRHSPRWTCKDPKPPQAASARHRLAGPAISIGNLDLCLQVV